MKGSKKYDQILDALQELMEDRDIRSISVSEIAKKAGIGKGSIYYYFPSKDALLDALVERSYQVSLETAKNLAGRTDLSPFMRMALLFEACRSSSTEFLKREMMIESQNKDSSKETAPAAQTGKQEPRSETYGGKQKDPETPSGTVLRQQNQEQQTPSRSAAQSKKK